MSASVIGFGCSGSDHRRRYWRVDSERRLSLREPMRQGEMPDALRHALALPIPGSANVLVCEPFRLFAVLNDGAAWRLNIHGTPLWLPLNRECDDMPKDKSSPPVFIAGGNGCGHLWVATVDRRVWVWGPSGRSPIGEAPVPGSGRIVTADAARKVVVLEGGERFDWLTSGWARMPGLFETQGGTLKCLVRVGVTLEGGVDAHEGTVVEVPEGEARRYIAQGRLELVASESA